MGIGRKFIVNIMGPIFAWKMLKYWKSSLMGSYTKNERMDILKQLGFVIGQYPLIFWI